MDNLRDPFVRLVRGLAATVDEVCQMQGYLHGVELGPGRWQRADLSPWVPDVEVYARQEDLIVRVELPGVEEEDVDLMLCDEQLIVSGLRKVEQEYSRDHRYVSLECCYSPFRRVVGLPRNVDESELSAYFYAGVLELCFRGGTGTGGVRPLPVEGPEA